MIEQLSDREYGYWLNNISGIGYVKINALLEALGSYKNIYYASVDKIEKVNKIRNSDLQNIIKSKNVRRIKTNLAIMESKGIRYVLRNEEKYPKKLKEIYNPPHILYYRGKLPDESKPTIAIVGARNCTTYGTEVTHKFAYELSKCGYQIISGMARGIDAAAHEGALLTEEGLTYGVLGCGIDCCYPPENINIFMETIEKGGIISEYPMYTTPKAGCFPMRNRIISGLADALLVVEARKKSGSLITVDLALEQGKDIYAIPGRLDDLLSEGCNNLIKIGAKLVTSVDDILEDNNMYYNNTYNEYTKGKFNTENENDIRKLCEKNKICLAIDEEIVYANLRLESKHIDEIVNETGLSYSEVIRILFNLEEKKLVARSRNNYYIKLNLG